MTGRGCLPRERAIPRACRHPGPAASIMQEGRLWVLHPPEVGAADGDCSGFGGSGGEGEVDAALLVFHKSHNHNSEGNWLAGGHVGKDVHRWLAGKWLAIASEGGSARQDVHIWRQAAVPHRMQAPLPHKHNNNRRKMSSGASGWCARAAPACLLPLSASQCATTEGGPLIPTTNTLNLVPTATPGLCCAGVVAGSARTLAAAVHKAIELEPSCTELYIDRCARFAAPSFMRVAAGRPGGGYVCDDGPSHFLVMAKRLVGALP